jgi:uncharacterized protein
LLLFGIVHAYLLWVGDILYPYALCALILYPFRNMKAKSLMTIGIVFLVCSGIAYIGQGYGQREMFEKHAQAQKAKSDGAALTKEQEEAERGYERWRSFSRPNAEELRKDAEEWRGSPLQVIKARAKFAAFFHGKPYYSPWNWDVWSMMFIGMALFKWKILTGEKPAGYYAKMAAIGYLIGIPLNSYTAWVIIQSNFDPATHLFANSTYDVGRLSIALGHLGMIMLLCRTGALSFLTSRLGAIGQMAFSNYIFQSVVTAFFFTGYGLKMYGRLERHELYYVVVSIWIVQLVVSPIWLRHFRFGPLEWGWRSLTYWKKQPMRLASERLQDTAAAA